MTVSIEFGGMPSADAAREEYSAALSEEDDLRLKTVRFEDGELSESDINRLEADADEDVAATSTRSHTESLTDRERKAIKEADGFSQTVTTANWRSAKGAFATAGMTDRFRDAIGALTDGDDPAELAESWVRDAKQGSNDGDARAVSGGGRDHGEEDIIDRQRQQAAAQVVLSEEFDNARRWCKKGDEDACDALVEEFDISRSEAMQMLGIAEDTTTEDTTEQAGLVTVGGDGEFPEMQITEAAAGALRDSWTSYKTATGKIEDAIETLREEVGRGRRSMNAINAIRDSGGQEEIEAKKLGTLLGRLAEMPGDIPNVSTLAEYGIFDEAGYADSTRSPPLDVDTGDVDPRGRTSDLSFDALDEQPSGAWNVTRDGYEAGGTSGKAIRVNDTGTPGVYHVQLIPETGSAITVAMNLRRAQAETAANLLANSMNPATIGHGGDRLTATVRAAFVGADPELRDALVERFEPRDTPLDVDTTAVDPRDTEDQDLSQFVEVRSPYRPLPRAARKALSQDFGGVEELEPKENHRGGGYLVQERPPETFLDKFELKVIRDPIVSYETDHGDVVDIYADPDRVIAGGTETNLTAVEAVQNAESEDRFTLTGGDPSDVPGWPVARDIPLDIDPIDVRDRRGSSPERPGNLRDFRDDPAAMLRVGQATMPLPQPWDGWDAVEVAAQSYSPDADNEGDHVAYVCDKRTVALVFEGSVVSNKWGISAWVYDTALPDDPDGDDLQFGPGGPDGADERSKLVWGNSPTAEGFAAAREDMLTVPEVKAEVRGEDIDTTPETRDAPLDTDPIDVRGTRRRRRQFEQDAANAREFKHARRMVDDTTAEEAADRMGTLREGDEHEFSRDGRRLDDVAEKPERERAYVNAIRKAEAREDWERVRRLQQRHEPRLDIEPMDVRDRRNSWRGHPLPRDAAGFHLTKRDPPKYSRGGTTYMRIAYAGRDQNSGFYVVDQRRTARRTYGLQDAYGRKGVSADEAFDLLKEKMTERTGIEWPDGDDGDDGSGSSEFAPEKQQTIAGNVDAEVQAQNEQVTLTGSDSNDAPRPTRWTPTAAEPTRISFDGGDVTVTARPDDLGEWEIWVTEGGDMETIAEVSDPDHAERIINEFVKAIQPPEVSLHKGDRAVPQAAAEAKAAAAPDDQGLGRFGGN